MTTATRLTFGMFGLPGTTAAGWSEYEYIATGARHWYRISRTGALRIYVGSARTDWTLVVQRPGDTGPMFGARARWDVAVADAMAYANQFECRVAARPVAAA